MRGLPILPSKLNQTLSRISQFSSLNCPVRHHQIPHRRHRRGDSHHRRKVAVVELDVFRFKL